jgi:hypothetical protein
MDLYDSGYVMGRSRILGGTRNYQKDDLFQARYGLRLPVSDPVLVIYEWVVSTLIKNTVLIGYFAKIPL